MMRFAQDRFERCEQTYTVRGGQYKSMTTGKEGEQCRLQARESASVSAQERGGGEVALEC